jgi:hypothetical protein
MMLSDFPDPRSPEYSSENRVAVSATVPLTNHIER